MENRIQLCAHLKGMHYILFMVMALIAVIGLTSGHAFAQGKEKLDDIIAAAKKEGKVVVYGGGSFRTIVKAAKKIFEKRYGIKVEYLRGRSRETRERINTEVRTGNHVADVANAGATSLPAIWQDGGLENWLPPSLKSIRPEILKSFGVPPMPITPMFLGLRGLFINTKLVAKGDEPKSWMDLTNPKWRGKILLDDPRSAGAGHSLFVSLLRHPGLGKEFHEKLAKNKPVFLGAGNYQQIASRIAQGEFAIGSPVDSYHIEKLKGATIKWIAPKEGVSYTINGIGLVKNADRPNAGKLFILFTMSEEFQNIIGRTHAPVRIGTPSKRKEWSLDYVNLLTRPFAESREQRQQFYRVAESIYGIR